MGATVNIPEPQYRRLKAKAEREGTTVRHVLLRCIDKELESESTRKSAGQSKIGHTFIQQVDQPKFPVITSKHPGSLQLGEEGVYEYIPFP
jgi:hypothetical protein